MQRLTFEGTQNRRVTWSPDGQSLTFVSNRSGQNALWTQRADGSTTAELVLGREGGVIEAFYSPDSTRIVFRIGGTLGGGDIFTIRPPGDSVPVPLVATEFGERSPTISPDGRWLAYVSTLSGREEVYVSPFPEASSALRQVSTDGGREPVWAHNGQELFYRNGAQSAVVPCGLLPGSRREQNEAESPMDQGEPTYHRAEVPNKMLAHRGISVTSSSNRKLTKPLALSWPGSWNRESIRPFR